VFWTTDAQVSRIQSREDLTIQVGSIDGQQEA